MAGDDLPDVDEDVLETGAGKERSRIRRLRLDLLLATVLLGGVLVVARAMSHHGGKPGATSAPSPTESVRRYGTGAPDSGSGLLNGMATAVLSSSDGTVISIVPLPPRESDDPTDCPSGFTCVGTKDVSAPARAAALSAFPRATIESAITVGLTKFANRPLASSPELWFAQLKARVGSRHILLRVQRAGPIDADRQSTNDGGYRSIDYVERVLPPYDVMVQVDSPGSQPQPLPPLEKLVRDVRLLTLE